MLAQLSVPMALNFSDARSRKEMRRMELVRSGVHYVDLLEDLDLLLEQSRAFQLDPWLESARRLAELDAAGGVQHDCISPMLSNTSACCRHFYEWNARCQVTTWNPTPFGATKVPGGPIDYAAKHWSGLVKHYYAKRARILFEQALLDEESQQELNATKVQQLFAKHAFEWTTSMSPSNVKVPDSASAASKIGEALDVTKEILNKYSSWFSSCDETSGSASTT